MMTENMFAAGERYHHLRQLAGVSAAVMNIRVFIADDHGILRGRLRAVISVQPDMEVVGEADNGPDAVNGIGMTEPEVALMDITMPNGGGLAAIADLTRVGSRTRILVLTMHDELAYVRAAAGAGALGYVVKSSVDTELVAAIRVVAQGRAFMDTSLGLRLAQEALEPGPTDAVRGRAATQLTGPEREIIGRVAEGYTNAQIAEELRLAIEAIEIRRSTVMQKLGLTSRADLVRFALERGILS
jgi:two-component system, NarL family, response regulator NreC